MSESDPNLSDLLELKLVFEGEDGKEYADPSNGSIESLENGNIDTNNNYSRNPPPGQSQLHISQLNVDCLEEICEYLSMKDLHSFGQTCKAMQQIAGEYFRRNHWAAEKFIESNGISAFYSDNHGVINERTLTTAFNEFITYISYYYAAKEPLHFIESHSDEFISVQHIYLVSTTLHRLKLKHFDNLLAKVKTIQLRDCTIVGDLYEILLEFCSSIKRLYLQDSHLGNEWLQQSYTHLEHLELIPIPALQVPNQLDLFFAQNPTVTSFSTSSYSLWCNRHALLKSEIKLDTLEVKIYRYYTVVTNLDEKNNEPKEDNEDYDEDDYDDTDSEDELDQDTLTTQSLCSLLNQLHERGFYKRLHLYIPSIIERNSEYVAGLRGLEKLCIKEFSESHSLAHLNGLKELAILDGANPHDMEILAYPNVNLQYLFIRNASYADLLPFVRRSVHLKCIKVFPKDKSSFNGDILNLVQLNKERSKLENARKAIIYVPDNVFLTTKWAINSGNTKLRFIEMRRSDSYEWDHHY